jgi:thymidylate kinase
MELPTGEKCFFVAFEGSDRLGKSTQAKVVPEILTAQGLRVACRKIPYKDSFTYDRIYDMLFSGVAEKEPVVFQTFQGINRRHFQWDVLPGLAVESDIVIVDRWNLSTKIYGTQGGVPVPTTDVILQGVLDPDLTLIFHGTPFKTDEEDDAYEKNKEFQEKVRSEYRKAADAAPDRVLINANRPPNEVTESVIQSILMHYVPWAKLREAEMN